LCVALLALFALYLYKLTRGDVENRELIGTAAAIGELPDRVCQTTVIALFILVADMILACPELLANSFIGVGAELGIEQIILVQCLAVMASEALVPRA